jgi:hypothetical protein
MALLNFIGRSHYYDFNTKGLIRGSTERLLTLHMLTTGDNFSLQYVSTLVGPDKYHVIYWDASLRKKSSIFSAEEDGHTRAEALLHLLVAWDYQAMDIVLKYPEEHELMRSAFWLYRLYLLKYQHSSLPKTSDWRDVWVS